MSARSSVSILILATIAALGCKKLNTGYCDSNSQCGDGGICSNNVCSLTDAGMDQSIDGAAGGAGKGGAGGAAGAGGMAGSAGGAAGKPFTCASANCHDTTPICDVDASSCVGCNQVPGSCGARGGGTPVCVVDAGTRTGICVGCLSNSDCKSATPICELVGTASSPLDTCRACSTSGNDCKQLNPMTPVCVPATDAAGGPQPGTCVGCLANSDCAGSGTSKKPICELTSTASTAINTCRACAKDAECGGPGVCMDDGHCAQDTEVMFVAASPNCPGNGTSASPYCSLTMAVPNLSATKHVMVILGGTNDQLTLATSGVAPVVLGRMNAAGDIGSVPANAATAITVNSDTVLIRDLTVNLGSATASKGIAVTGAGTSLSLRRVTVSLGTKGLGIDAESGATLAMDECYVENNPVGGILVNGATANIQNTVIGFSPAASSGYGIQFNVPGSGTQFMFNTVVGYPTAATSDFSHQVVLNYSIVVGQPTNCTLNDCVIAAPTFSATNPYHLTIRQMCPTTPTTFPGHDIDGQARTSTTLSCGADEYVP